MATKKQPRKTRNSVNKTKSNATAPTGQTTVQTMRNSKEASPRPKHIVVSAQDKNLQAMVRAITTSKGIAEATHEPGSLGTTCIRTPAGEADIQIFATLGAMALDLSPEQRTRLESNGAIVAENQQRSIPPHEELVNRHRAQRPLPDFSGIVPQSMVQAFVLGQLSALRQVYELDRRLQPNLGRFSSSSGVIAATHSWCLSLIGITPDYTGPTGRGVKVAVLDTGLDLQHPDFAGRVPASNAQDFTNSGSAQDVQGHGTHCAGIIAGPVNSSGGTRYGAAPDVTLYAGKVLDDSGRGSDDTILSGMTWAAEQQVRIISMSLGSPRQANEPSSTVYERIASRLRTQGILIVAAAGNESSRPSLIAPVGNPAACPSILAIGAVDEEKQIGSFSCGGVDSIGVVDFAGPGVEVYSSLPVARGSFGVLSGTSMATPYTAGLFAIYLEQNSDWTPDQLQQNGRTDGSRPARDFGKGILLVP